MYRKMQEWKHLWLSNFDRFQLLFHARPRAEFAKRRWAARSRAGLSRRRYCPKPAKLTELDSIEDIRDLSFRVVTEMREGKIDIKSGNALAFACRVALQAAEAAERRTGPVGSDDCSMIEYEVRALKELVEHGKSGRTKLTALDRLAKLREMAMKSQRTQRSSPTSN